MLCVSDLFVCLLVCFVCFLLLLLLFYKPRFLTALGKWRPMNPGSSLNLSGTTTGFSTCLTGTAGKWAGTVISFCLPDTANCVDIEIKGSYQHISNERRENANAYPARIDRDDAASFVYSVPAAHKNIKVWQTQIQFSSTARTLTRISISAYRGFGFFERGVDFLPPPGDPGMVAANVTNPVPLTWAKVLTNQKPRGWE